MQLEYPECVIAIDEIKAVYDKGDIIEKKTVWTYRNG